MKASEADKLKCGDKVITKNGPYIQNAVVDSVETINGMRWINYHWLNPQGQKMAYSKRYMSVYLPFRQEATNE
jgi:hypothetical protein